MRVYSLRSGEDSMDLMLDKTVSAEHPIESKFTGDSKITVWTPPILYTNNKRKYNDFPRYLTGHPIISEKVKNILFPIIAEEIECLPLAHPELKLFMLNITNVIDCVDYSRSVIKLTGKGNFARFIKQVFDFSKIPEKTYMFKIKETAIIQVFVTDKFKELVELHGLKGLDFSEVYDSAFTADKEEEQERNYQAALDSIERSKGIEFSYDEARILMEQGKAVASGKWRMQLDENGELWIADLTPALLYDWGQPIYIPPVLMLLQWHEVEKSEINL
ncbi:imm11 family protein [Paenibacillus borealis]|uniref:Immunity MXAN-0049 protein domain-containing protein n=1 Tax=Paenibacillus borealis TaxID=160799 RepID=A0A089LNA6_PAEBO|nr:DUF1629 domain-containing protein [Paenibacillus borealis]AIQ60658.1 hypothetical protein PBOR_29755 [Paenibacillus borealis]